MSAMLTRLSGRTIRTLAVVALAVAVYLAVGRGSGSTLATPHVGLADGLGSHLIQLFGIPASLARQIVNLALQGLCWLVSLIFPPAAGLCKTIVSLVQQFGVDYVVSW